MIMDEMVPVKNCTGCAACRFCCPQDAIDMVEDGEGFLYPQSDPKKCNTCGRCISKCPVQSGSSIKSNDTPTLYAAWTNDRELLQQSTSGGVFSEIARDVIEDGGLVYGAAYDNTMTVRHIAAETLDNLQALRGSKYVQSDVCDTYLQVEKYLNSGRRVLFSGTPCQIAGLGAAIGNDHAHLLTCDLICHGVPSPKVFRMAIDSLAKQKNSKVVDFLFREKTYGWLYPEVRIAFADNTFLMEGNGENHFNLGFLKNIYLRPACHQCPIKSGGSRADITLGDFWSLLKFQPSLINRGGTSAILVNSEHGRQTLQHCVGRFSLSECPFSFIENESNLFKSAKPSHERAAFFADIDRLPFDELTRKYIKPRSAMISRMAKIRRMVRRWIEERK